MGKVSAQFSMSLDGFVAGLNDDIGHVLAWYRRGDTEFSPPGSRMTFKVSRQSAEYLQREWSTIGTIVTGRGDFDASEAYGGTPPFNVPMFVVTHRPPAEWMKEGSPFTFVTEGPIRALELARAASGDKDVDVGGTTIVRQVLQAGLLDEIRIDLVPVLLGGGTRLFDRLDNGPFPLEKIGAIDTPHVTHLKYRVVR